MGTVEDNHISSAANGRHADLDRGNKVEHLVHCSEHRDSNNTNETIIE